MTCATIFFCLSFKNEQLLQFRKFCFWFLNHKPRNATDKNSSLNVNNRSLEFIDKNGSRVHLSHRLKRNFRFVKTSWELSDLTLYTLLYYVRSDFCKFRLWSSTRLSECSRMHNLQIRFTRTSFKGLSRKLAIKLKKFSEKHFACIKTHWMHKMSAVILWNSCFSRAGKRWLCIN